MPRLADRVAPSKESETRCLAARAELIAALRAGEHHALKAVFEEFGHLVFAACARLLLDDGEAEDATQDLFVRLPVSIAGFAGTETQFPGWLRRIAVRSALMRMRGRRRRREVRVDDVAALVSRPDDVLGRITIETALASLREEHRTVFILKEVEGYSHAEIGELLEISVANSEMRLHRARRQLRDLLRESR